MTNRVFASSLLAFTLAASASAQDPEPGSVLCYPSVRETAAATIVSITNTHPSMSIVANFSYVSVVPSTVGNPFEPDACFVNEVQHVLTPNDTITLAVRCDNPAAPLNGYLMVDAQTLAGVSISHNYLIGSAFTVQGPSAVYSLAAISFQSPLPDGAPTDLDGDGELDFDGLEYTMCPQELYIDTFLASVGNRLALLNLTGGTPFTASLSITVYNDNEQPVVIDHKFRCWFDQPLDLINPAFSIFFLLGTLHDPAEFDTDCNGTGDLETGWARIRGTVANSGMQIIPGPALLGAITGTTLGFERGRPLWRRGNNPNGDFLGVLPIHPEFP